MRPPRRYLLVADPVETLDPRFDLGVCVAGELIRRGIPVDYMDLLAADPTLPAAEYLANLEVREILASDRRADPFWQLGPPRRAAIEEYGVVLQRKDPPVDELFVAHCRRFEAAPPWILQINRPPATWQLSEHTVILDYPEFAAPTWVCGSVERLVEVVRSMDGEAVVKPLCTYCGIGVEFFPPDVPEATLRDYLERWGPEVVVQPYLPEIERTGDLRILTLGERVLGSVLRVPARGSRLANLHQGASARRLDPTPRQLEACRVVARDLAARELHLLGFDFIGEHLTEVNFTSPTTIVQINEVMGIRADVTLVDELERMRESRSG